ncbi:zinc finger domain-containing ring-type protein [Phlyctema vagabunda]|uniref:Zinc finger domain-containing ring-type protein n=1 Tax=Phlyctema vagabunda TaxID=108571 RepID=A0ABR4PDR4_9HELO
MANPYEVEHNIQEAPRAPSRRPDMSTFFSQVNQISRSATSTNAHAQPTGVEMAAAARLLVEQFSTLRATSSSAENVALLDVLMQAAAEGMHAPPDEVEGVPASFLDELERVDRRELVAAQKSQKNNDSCPICAEKFLDDPYPLVVRLPCHPDHWFDLDCVGPWLTLKGTCPLDRKDLRKRKVVVEKRKEEEEEEDYDDMYA